RADASAAPCGSPSVMSPAGEPLSAIRCAPSCPKAPALFCDGQKFPSPAVADVVPVVNGIRSIGTAAWNAGRDGRHSRLVCRLPTAVQVSAASGLAVAVLVFQVG